MCVIYRAHTQKRHPENGRQSQLHIQICTNEMMIVRDARAPILNVRTLKNEKKKFDNSESALRSAR